MFSRVKEVHGNPREVTSSAKEALVEGNVRAPGSSQEDSSGLGSGRKYFNESISGLGGSVLSPHNVLSDILRQTDEIILAVDEQYWCSHLITLS